MLDKKELKVKNLIFFCEIKRTKSFNSKFSCCIQNQDNNFVAPRWNAFLARQNRNLSFTSLAHFSFWLIVFVFFPFQILHIFPRTHFYSFHNDCSVGKNVCSVDKQQIWTESYFNIFKFLLRFKLIIFNQYRETIIRQYKVAQPHPGGTCTLQE